MEKEEIAHLPEAQGKKYFAPFQEMSSEAYIFYCMPKLNPEDQEKALKVYEHLLSEAPSPIEEGNSNSLNSLGKLLKEGGYSFPPTPSIQGPFLAACGQSPLKRVLDIGPGRGSDTIMALLTQNTQVIAVDIYQEQLNILAKRVQEICEGKKIGRFNMLNRDLSTTAAPEKYQAGFDIINANKVFHFLNDAQTKKMLENFHFMLKKDGLVFITVSTLTSEDTEYAQFIKNKEAGVIPPGIVYYNIERKAITHGHNKTVIGFLPQQKEMLSSNKAGLPTPGHKREKMIQKGDSFYHVNSQARHFHDLATLESYLSPLFEIVDNTTYAPNRGNDRFLSIVARKK